MPLKLAKASALLGKNVKFHRTNSVGLSASRAKGDGE